MIDEVERLYRLLRRHVGADRAVSSKDVERMLGLGERDVRRAVMALVRRCDVPVCSSMHHGQHGYWLPVSLREVLDSVEPRIKHGKSELASAYRLKHVAQDRFEGQGVFEFGEIGRKAYPPILRHPSPAACGGDMDDGANAAAEILDEILREAPAMADAIAPILRRHERTITRIRETADGRR